MNTIKEKIVNCIRHEIKRCKSESLTLPERSTGYLIALVEILEEQEAEEQRRNLTDQK